MEPPARATSRADPGFTRRSTCIGPAGSGVRFDVHQPAFEHVPVSYLVGAHQPAQPEPGRARRFTTSTPWAAAGSGRPFATTLRSSRAVHCEPDQIMVVSGSQQALDITARVLLDSGDSVWVEEPSYAGWDRGYALLLAGCRLVPVPVDENGLDATPPGGIRSLPRGRRAAYVTPSHQFPLGSTMSAARRLQLLDWAESRGGVDY